MPPAAILDIDGTLVDTNYHHAIAWYRAFRQHGVIVPVWRLHRHMGMGGEFLVESVAGERVETELGDDIRAAEGPLYMSLIDEVELMEGARELCVELRQNGHKLMLASSGKAKEVEHYVDLLGARDLADGWTDSSDAESSKPEPDLVTVSMNKLGTQDAVMVGDSTYDCEAAAKVGVPTVGLLTGGYSERELTEAGAVIVFESIQDLRRRLEETPFG